MLVRDDDGAALRGERHARERVTADARAREQPLARLAQRPPVEVRVLLAAAGRARDVRLDRDLGDRLERAGRVEHHRPHALGADVEREDAVGGHARDSTAAGATAGRSTPGFMIPSGSNVRTTASSAAMPSGALLRREVRRVIGADAVVMGDRRALGDDRVRGGPLDGQRPCPRLVRVGAEPEQVGHVQAGARRVDVRQVGEHVDPLVPVRERRADRQLQPREQARQPRPVGGGLERLGAVAGRDERVAQVRRPQAGPVPGVGERGQLHATVPAERGAGLAPRRLHGARRPARPDQEQAPVGRPASGTEVRAQRAELAGLVGEREQRARLLDRRQAEHRQAGSRPGEVARRLEPLGPAGHRPRVEAVGVGERGRPQHDVGEEPEPALRPEDELAEVRARRGGRERRQVERSRGRLEDAAREQLLDPPETQAAHPRAAGRDPAADRRELERLRLVADGQAVRRQRLGECRPGRPGASAVTRPDPLVDGRHAGEPRQVDGDERVGRRPGVDAADDARAAAIRDQPGSRRSGEVEDRADLGAVCGPGDGIGDRVEAAEPQVEQVGERLAAGVPDASLGIGVEEVVRGNPRGRHGLDHVRERREGRRGGGADLRLDERAAGVAEMRVDVLEPPAVPTPHRAIVPDPVAPDAARPQRD